jgi:hypothetical protein
MCNHEEIKCRLISLAESVRAEVQFDMDFKVEPAEFFHLKFKNDNFETVQLSNSLYKYYTNG